MEKQVPRWIERLVTFQKAMVKLSDVVSLYQQHSLNEYERDSLIKRFEFTYEMAWKLMMSYEKENGVTSILGSKDVVRHAYNMTLIENGEAWMDMIDTRNQTSHLYDEQMAADVTDEIIHNYYPLLVGLQTKMKLLCTE